MATIIYRCARKPEPDFYLLACKRNEIQPHEAVFLDDLGMLAHLIERLHIPSDHANLQESQSSSESWNGDDP